MLQAAVRSAEQWSWGTRIAGTALLFAVIAAAVALYFVTTRR